MPCYKQGWDKSERFRRMSQKWEPPPSSLKRPNYLGLSDKIRKGVGVESKNGPLLMCFKHRSMVERKINRNSKKIVDKFSDFLSIFQKYADFFVKRDLWRVNAQFLGTLAPKSGIPPPSRKKCGSHFRKIGRIRLILSLVTKSWYNANVTQKKLRLQIRYTWKKYLSKTIERRENRSIAKARKSTNILNI